MHARRMKERYSARLVRLQTAPWKRWLDVQRPYRNHLRALELGRVLEIGCGVGRNLDHLRGHAVGVDLDPESIDYVRSVRGLVAYTTSEFPSAPEARLSAFDTLLYSHVLEHLDASGAEALVTTYLPYLRDGGRVLIITPQERGFDTDPTHVRFFDEHAAEVLAAAVDLRLDRSYSFPFPRPVGRIFRYNEFVFLLRRR